MSLAALDIALTPGGVRIRPPVPAPVEALLLGRTPLEAAELLPRLFNLCRAAQGMGARLALGLPLGPQDHAALGCEILHEHLARFCVLWPRRLGLPPAPLPGPGALGAAIFGPAARLPDPDDFPRWLAAGAGVAPVLAAIADAFAPGEAVADLPAPRPETLVAALAQENTPAARNADAPLLSATESRFGRGPLWRALARLADLDALAAGRADLAPRRQGNWVFVPAARGCYALSARVGAGRVTAFARMTPTDHLLAPGGALAQALATLPPARAHLAPLVVDILDPCIAVTIREAQNA
ncbi:HupK protein [Rhodovulum strictum]|uniref:HupK protein n=1 Tax=Rhodovulum strictum TaxID=58314 RepID=A0A844B3C7_9RHOB|nr:HupK protein [Rhodovulum strictum]MRH20641.1 HupK protein [Rhodovulum strictum]